LAGRASIRQRQLGVLGDAPLIPAPDLDERSSGVISPIVPAKMIELRLVDAAGHGPRRRK